MLEQIQLTGLKRILKSSKDKAKETMNDECGTMNCKNLASVHRSSFIVHGLLSLCIFCVLCASLVTPQPQQGALRNPPHSAGSFTPADDVFLEDLSHRAFLYFQEHSNPTTGLVLDRARADGRAHDATHPSFQIASSAATGFGLTALCTGAERGWITRDAARERTRMTLRFLVTRAPHKRGWFLHWMDARTGERRWRSEYSSIDTALLLAGVLTARGYFSEDAEITRLATVIYNRVDFPWMLRGRPALLSHGWKPETGFLRSRWDTYSEHLILQLLAAGSPTHPIPPSAWRAWRRAPQISYAGYRYLDGAPLFIHQYSHAWVDFRGRRDNVAPYTDFFTNSIRATRAHRQFCIALARRFPRSYSANIWGITASDSRKGYVAWYGPPQHPAIDGTVVPCAAGGSLMFTPDIAIPALVAMREKFGARVYGRYGFADAFNPTTGWTASDVIGINVGITLLSAENLRTGNIWQWFMRNAEIPRAMDAVGLKRVNQPAQPLPAIGNLFSRPPINSIIPRIE